MNARVSIQTAVSLFGAALLSSNCQAQTSFTINFNDPGGTYASYYNAIRTNVTAAGQTWVSHFVNTIPVDLAISINFTSEATASSASASAAYRNTSGGYDIYEQGAYSEIRTGVDPNGATNDINLNIGTAYLQNELWFDPNPLGSGAVVPSSKTDAYSVFMHEFGHDFVFNGFRNGTTGSLPSNYESTYDSNIIFTNGNLYFTGANAVGVYGGNVPLTFGNYAHVGNAAPRPGSDLLTDLMDGVVFYRGTRYTISDLDLAIAKDSGVVLRAPAPAPSALLTMLAGGASGALSLLRRRRKPQS